MEACRSQYCGSIVAILPPLGLKSIYPGPVCVGGFVMRIFALLAVLIALSIGGCFHHQEVITTPIELPPLK